MANYTTALKTTVSVILRMAVDNMAGTTSRFNTTSSPAHITNNLDQLTTRRIIEIEHGPKCNMADLHVVT